MAPVSFDTTSFHLCPFCCLLDNCLSIYACPCPKREVQEGRDSCLASSFTVSPPPATVLGITDAILSLRWLSTCSTLFPRPVTPMVTVSLHCHISHPSVVSVRQPLLLSPPCVRGPGFLLATGVMLDVVSGGHWGGTAGGRGLSWFWPLCLCFSFMGPPCWGIDTHKLTCVEFPGVLAGGPRGP